MENHKKILSVILGLGLVTAFTTVLVATLTVTLGKYLEQKKEIESHFRDKKILIYDEFLKKLFGVFGADRENPASDELTKFLREWQRKVVVWGGSDVLVKYIDWKSHLTSTAPGKGFSYALLLSK